MESETLSFILSNVLSFSIPLIFSTSQKFGFFEGLSDWITSEELSKEKGTDRDGTQRLLEALHLMGILERKGEAFRIKEKLSRYLDPSSAFSILGTFENIPVFLKNWIMLPDRLKGKRPLPRDPGFFIRLSRALFSVNAENAERLRELLGESFKEVLDLGSGSCVWSVPFARSGSKVTALDYGEVIDNVAVPMLSSLGLIDRYSFLKGNMWSVAWGGPYDLIIMAHILHSLKEEGAKKLLAMARSILKDGGILCVVDYLRDGKSIPPYIFNVHMYVMTGGKVYSVDEIEALAAGTGFSRVYVRPLDEGRGIYASLLFK